MANYRTTRRYRGSAPSQRNPGQALARVKGLRSSRNQEL